MKLIDFVIGGNGSGGGNSIMLLPPSTVAVEVGDGTLRATFTAAANAEAYRVEAATNSGFTAGLVSVVVTDLKAVLSIPNATAHYVRVSTLKVGSTPSAPKVAAGTYTGVAADRLERPVMQKRIGVNNGIFLAFTTVAGQEQTKAEISTSPFFSTIEGTAYFTGTSGIIPATNGVDYFVRIRAVSDLKRPSYTVFDKKGIDGGYNTVTPHAITSGKLHTPYVNEVLIQGAGSVKVDACSGDVRDSTYTAELHASRAFSSVLFTVTGALSALAFTGMTDGTPYKLRIKSNASGLTSSDWYEFPDVVLSGVNVGLAEGIATGDSNTAGLPYGTPYVTQAIPFLNSTNWGGAPVLRNGGVGSTGVADQLYVESSPYALNWAGYNGSVTRNPLTLAYGTNDGTIKGKTSAQFVAELEEVCIKRFKQGFKLGILTPGIPYGGGWANISNFIYEITEFVKANGKTLLRAIVTDSLFDTEEFDISNCATGTESDCTLWGGQLHYTTAGYGWIAENKYAPMVNTIAARIFVKAAAPTALNWNSGTQRLSITVPAGWEAADFEISYDYDGRVGFPSTWVKLTTLTNISVAAVQASGTVAVRGRAAGSVQTSAMLVSAQQYN